MTQHAGGLVQGSYGTNANNFELVTAAPNGEGLVHYSRDNADKPPRWAGPTGFGFGRVSGVSLIQSDFGPQRRNLEAVACEAGALVHYWREDPSFIWYRRTTPVAAGVQGTPALLQRPPLLRMDGTEERGDFEVVVPRAGGGLAHWWRRNTHPDLVWEGPDLFGEGEFQAVAITQSNFGPDEPPELPDGPQFRPRGNLEVVARQGGRLLHFWRDDDTAAWQGPREIDLDFEVTGSPALIQSTYGTRGDFELVVPVKGGGLVHLARDNDHDRLPWKVVHRFPGPEMEVAGFIQGSFGPKGNLELVVRSADRLEHHWMSSDMAWTWYHTDPVAIEHVRAESEGIYRWMASYLQEGTHIVVRVELLPERGIGEEELAEVRARWEKGIRDAWNCGCRCRTARGAMRPLSFDVEWVVSGSQGTRRPYDRARDAPGHHRVVVKRYKRRATLLEWGLNTEGAVAAHEFGHMLGLPDEYATELCPARHPVNTGSLMDVTDGKVLPRMVEHLCAPMCSQTALMPETVPSRAAPPATR